MGTNSGFVLRLKGMPSPHQRPAHRILAITLALAGLLTGYLIAAPATHATTTTPTYTGTGWKAWTSNGIYSLSPQPYTIVFADPTARAKLAPYFTGPAAQVTTSVGVPINVSLTFDLTRTNTCPAWHRIIVHYVYQPMGTKGMSQTLACHNTADGSAWGAHILMDNEYWTNTAWFSTNSSVNDARRRDVAAHELGHALGLDHPNTDVNKDGTIAGGECVKNSAGLRPLMCSPNRGNPPVAAGGKFTAEFDLPGLRQLLANYRLRQG